MLFGWDMNNNKQTSDTNIKIWRKTDEDKFNFTYTTIVLITKDY